MASNMLRSILGASGDGKGEAQRTSAQRRTDGCAQEQHERAASQDAFGQSSPRTTFSDTADSTARGRRGSDAAGSETDDDDERTAVYHVPRIEFCHKGHDHFWLFNSSPHPVVLDGVTYKTAEHLFQASKFNGHRPDIAARVRKAASPSDAMLEARKNLNEVREGWVRLGLNVNAMRQVLLLKFTQHSDLRRQLLFTGDAQLVEANPGDVFWASGAALGRDNGFGRNQLGRALMKVRETLRSSAGLGSGLGALSV